MEFQKNNKTDQSWSLEYEWNPLNRRMMGWQKLSIHEEKLATRSNIMVHIVLNGI